MPQQPNYNRNTGRLTTDRFDFEKHINATDDRHDGYDIDMVPTIVIGGNSYTNVRAAIDALNAIVSPASVQDATTSVKGILKLAQDLAGTASAPKVIGIQNRAISTLTPTDSQVLTWNGTTHVWEPQTSLSSFTTGNDLAGDNVSQQVISLTGSGGTSIQNRPIPINCGIVQFNSTVTSPSITQITTSSSVGAPLTIKAQSTSLANQPGGSLILSGGTKNGSGAKGGVSLRMNGGATTEMMLQLVEPISGQRVLGLLKAGVVNSTDMPANTGDMVMFIGNTTTPPTSGTPANGVIMFADSGVLKIKQADGTVFPVGSIPNPTIWGPTGAQTYTRQFTLTTTNATPINAATFTCPDNTSTKLDVLVVARNTAAAQSAHFNMTMGYVRFGGAPQPVGGVTIADPRSTTGAETWAATITTSSNDAVVQITGEAGKTIKWFVIIQAMLDS